jgi:hypothetical protein
MGGKHSAKIYRLKALAPPRLRTIYDELEEALYGVKTGALTPGQANAMANVARAMAQLLEVGELEDKVRQLEEAAGQARNHWSA